jgi:hypothetical protein
VTTVNVELLKDKVFVFVIEDLIITTMVIASNQPMFNVPSVTLVTMANVLCLEIARPANVTTGTEN